jgi:tetratricopeptide (TPR) repeat protein
MPGRKETAVNSRAELRAYADALKERAEHEPEDRARRLAEAAECHAMLGENQLAEQLFGQALENADAPVGITHGRYASFLLDHGREVEALDLINQARRLRPVDPVVFNLIGQALLAHEHPAQAARWFTTGLVRALGDLAEIELDDLVFSDVMMLMRGRHEARRALDQPVDHLDEIFDRYRAERDLE